MLAHTENAKAARLCAIKQARIYFVEKKAFVSPQFMCFIRFLKTFIHGIPNLFDSSLVFFWHSFRSSTLGSPKNKDTYVPLSLDFLVPAPFLSHPCPVS